MRHRSLQYINGITKEKIKLTTFNVLSAFIRFVKSLTNFKHKAIALFAFAVLFCLFANAQRNSGWEFTANIGGQAFYRLHKTKGVDLNPKNKIGMTFYCSATRLFSPAFGLGLFYQGGLMSNYYLKTGQPNDWTYHSVHAGGTINLSNWIYGYSSQRFYSLALRGNIGLGFSSNKESSAKTLMLGGGIQNRFALSPNLAVSLSIGITLTNANFDNTGSGFRFGGLYDVTAGIVYNIFDFQPTQKNKRKQPKGIFHR